MCVAAIRADHAFGIEVLERLALEHFHHLVRIQCAGLFYSLQIVHGGRVVGGLHVSRHALGLVLELLAKGAGFVVQVPVPAGGQQQAFGIAQAQRVHIGQEHQQASELHVLVDAELLGCLDGVDGVTTGIGQSQNLGLGVLCLQQEAGEVRSVQRMAHTALDVTALGLDHVSRVVLQRMAKGVVRCQEEPFLAAVIDHSAACALGQRHRVIGVVNGVGRALLIGQGRSACAIVDVDALFLLRHLGQRQGHARVGAAQQHAQVLCVNPLARLGGGNVGLVLVIQRQQLDGLAQHLAAEVVNRHLNGNCTVLAVYVCIVAGHVGDKADLDLVWCLRVGHASHGQREGERSQRGTQCVHVCLLVDIGMFLCWCNADGFRHPAIH